MQSKKITYSAVMIALGVLLPQLFHTIGGSGVVFLPMHIPVIIAGFIIGPAQGLIIGGLVTIISAVITQMPAVPVAYFMFFELTAYGFFAGVFYRKIRMQKYVALILTMVFGRVVYVFTAYFATFVLKLPYQFLTYTALVDKFVISIPGVIIQIITIPIIVLALEKGGYTVCSNRYIKRRY